MNLILAIIVTFTTSFAHAQKNTSSPFETLSFGEKVAAYKKLKEKRFSIEKQKREVIAFRKLRAKELKYAEDKGNTGKAVEDMRSDLKDADKKIALFYTDLKKVELETADLLTACPDCRYSPKKDKPRH